MIDPYIGHEINRNIYEAGDIAPVNQELICTYIDLQSLLDRCQLSNKQKYIIHKFMSGYTEEDIAEELRQDVWRINKILDTVADKVKKANDYDWKYNYVYLNHKKVQWDYKKCSKCEEFKPMTDEFYGKDNRIKDGFKSYCKECDNYTKKAW